MRITTVLSIGIVAVSSAALAQVGSNPRTGRTMPGNTITSPSNSTTSDTMTPTNDMAPMNDMTPMNDAMSNTMAPTNTMEGPRPRG